MVRSRTTPASSTPTSPARPASALLTAVALATLTLAGTAGCTTGAGHSGPSKGTALTASGPITQGVMGVSDSTVGNIEGFAFPLLTNSSRNPVVVTGFTVTGIPGGVRVIGYPVYSESDTTQYRMAYGFKPKDSDFDLSKYPDYAGKKFTIAPGKQSNRYAMVKIEVTGPVKHHITGCVVHYTQSGQEFSQTVPCEFALDKS